jgi:ABC-type multidrug transport system ATPase subunit
VEREKIILLTTHHLEEAELLSDFVVVLSRGKAVESGSLHQLKKTFSVGNQIKLSRKKDINTMSKALNFENEKKKIFSKISENTREQLVKLDIEQLDASSIIIKSGNLSNEELQPIIEDIEKSLSSKYYVAVNSCTFDDIFREIDKIYEQGSGTGNEKQVLRNFKNYANYVKSKC